jgi:hypothetical protein
MWLFVSAARTRAPLCENDTLVGPEKEALVPTPSKTPWLLEPASDDTLLVERSIDRTRWLSVSATTTRVPSCENETPLGLLNSALAPTPFADPALPLPASDVTMRECTLMRRILWFPRSATAMRVPSEEKDTSSGFWNEALVPTPSAEPGHPSFSDSWHGSVNPASVVTTFVATLMMRIT